jgi:uncharacterized membrane protein YjfL (UPF0719 family)
VLTGLAYGAAYSIIGILLLAAGFFAFDLATPGRLGERIYQGRSINAAILVAAAFLGLGAVEFTAIWTNAARGFGEALAWTVGFGLLGVVLQVGSFLALDALTPGSLRDIVVEREFHPGALVAAASIVAVSAVVCASIA